MNIVINNIDITNIIIYMFWGMVVYYFYRNYYYANIRSV